MTVPYSARRSRNGRTIKEAAQLTGLTEQTIKRWTSEPRSEYEARAAARHERIQQLRDEGLSMRAIAAQLNISVGTVHYALHKDAESA